MSEPPAPEPGPEITIDLDGDPEPEPEPPRARIPNAALVVAAVIIALAAGVVTAAKWAPGQEPSSVTTVRSFLEAVQAGDVDTALGLAKSRTGMSDFLVPEALDDRWKINEVAQVGYQDNPGRWPLAEVYAEIEAYDGTRLAYRYEVSFEGGRPLIIDGLGSTEYGAVGLGRLEVNGFVASPDRTEQFLLLLPGVYHFYESTPETLDMGMEPVLVLGDKFLVLDTEQSSSWLSSPWPQVTDEGNRVIREAVREHYDGCAERPEIEGCAFAPPAGDERVTIPDDAVWEITAYPQVTATYSYWGGDSDQGFELVTTQPGMAEVDAVVTDADGGERRTRLSCGIWAEGLFAMLDFNGGASIRPGTQAERTCRGMVEVG